MNTSKTRAIGICSLVPMAALLSTSTHCTLMQAPTLIATPSSVLPADWGRTLIGSIFSNSLGAQRKINIFLPKSYDSTKRMYPVVYVTDGEYYFQRAVTAVRQLSAVGHMPEAIVVAIVTPERRQDMTPPGMSLIHSDGPDQRAEKFMRFMTNELKPQITSQFRGGAPSVLMGHSHGGILCAYAAADWRQDFPFQVILDAPIHLDNNWLAAKLLQSVPAKGNLRIVSVDAKFGWSDEEWKKLTTYAPKNWKLMRSKLQGEDHETMAFGGFYYGLKQMFADYSAVAVKEMPGPDAFNHYRKLEQSYGATVVPPLFVLDRALRDLVPMGEGELARSALKIWADNYGPVPESEKLLADIAEAEREMKGRETVNQLLALNPPSASEIAPFVGVWRGHSWVSVDENNKSPMVVTIRVENGHGIAFVDNPEAPAEFRNKRQTYLRVTKDGIEFGGINDMSPRGILANVGKIIGGKLEGENVFRGIYFKRKTGVKHLFSLTRV